MKITDVPFNQHIGIAMTGEGELTLPADPRYTNHLGTVHASALLSLAEAASGDWLIRAMEGSIHAVLPVVRRFEAKFRKPAQGAIFAEATATANAEDELHLALETKGRHLLEIRIEVRDEHGTHVLSAVAEWFVVKRD